MLGTRRFVNTHATRWPVDESSLAKMNNSEPRRKNRDETKQRMDSSLEVKIPNIRKFVPANDARVRAKYSHAPFCGMAYLLLFVASPRQETEFEWKKNKGETINERNK